MKPHPELTIEDLMTGLREAVSKDVLPEPVGGSVTMEERAKAGVALAAAVADMATKVKTLCVACNDPYPLQDTTPCVCGGFVCQACRAVEVEGECDHTPDLSGLPGEGDDDV